MRLRLLVLSLAAVAAVTAGCGQRQRLNPFDPGNPVTGGRPPGFVALAGNQMVTLRWNSTPAPGLLGYELFRRVAGDTAFTLIGGLISPTVTAIADFGLQNGVDHEYRLYYVFERGLGSLFSEDLATPGPLVPWVADYGRAVAVRLTADGRRILSEDGGYAGPTDVAVDPAREAVWISDTNGGQLVIYNPRTGQHLVIGTAPAPAALALDPVDGGVWVCDGQSDAVFHFQSDGSTGSPFMLSPISNPLDATVDGVDRSLWVCERGADHLRHFTSSGSPAGFVNLIAPSRVAVDSATHAAWATSFTTRQVFVVSNVPAVRESIGGFQGPIGIAVDARRGRVWIADAPANQVVALRRDGTEEFRIGGLGEPHELAIDLASGNAWVTLSATGEVAVLSPTGTVIRRVGGLTTPAGLSLGVEP